MSEHNNNSADDKPVEPSGKEGGRSARREVLKAGALIVPAIVTLHAKPAWAATDYTVVAYRYGDRAGLCRNPHFNPNANTTSQASREFIECPGSGRPDRRSPSATRPRNQDLDDSRF